MNIPYTTFPSSQTIFPPQQLNYNTGFTAYGQSDSWAFNALNVGTAATSSTLMAVPLQPYSVLSSNNMQGGYPFGHLLNFFASNGPFAATNTNDPVASNPLSSTTSPNYGMAASNYYRLFEFVTVPSRMSGTEDLLVPVTQGVTLGSTAALNQSVIQVADWPGGYPVYHRHSSYLRAVVRHDDDGNQQQSFGQQRHE